MFSKLKLSMKIGFGFGILGVLMAILGVFMSVNMGGVRVTSNKLADIEIAQVKVANDVERYSLETMYNMRGYSLSEDKKYLELGKQNLENVKKSIKSAQELAAKYPSELDNLKQNADKAAQLVNDYANMVNDTVTLNEGIEKNRTALDTAAAGFIKNCDDYLNVQDGFMDNEVSGGLDRYTVSQLDKKKETMNEIIDLGNSIRIAVQKSDARRDSRYIQDAQKTFDTLDSKLNDLKAISKSNDDLTKIENIRSAANTYKTSTNEFLNNKLALTDLNDKRGKTADEVLALSRSVASNGIAEVESGAKSASSTLNFSMVIVIVGIIIAILIGISVGVIIIRGITAPINKIVSGLYQGAEQVAAASVQLSSSSQTLAEGNSQQAAALEETSATLEQSASMIGQNSENTRQAAALASQAKVAADKGSSEMVEMMVSMEEIKKSSDQISKIIKVIDEIAFQTNILALNAAVEAARAGEAGMGFAVVAEEVRNLAQRSAKAAKDTAEMIEHNIESSNKGVTVARKVGDSLNEIMLQAKKVNDLMEQVALASQEQAQGVAQINKALSQMESVTQQNAAGAEETASSSEELSAQAETLKDIVRNLSELVYGQDSNDALGRLKGQALLDSPAKTYNNRLSSGVGSSTRNYASGTGYKSSPVKKTHVVKPEDIIPLEDDPGDF